MGVSARCREGIGSGIGPSNLCAHPMRALLPKPLQITVYQDVLCSWCYLADLRLDILRTGVR